MHGNSTVQYLQYCMVDRRHVYHSIMMNVTWQNFDQSAEQLIVCYTTNENHALIKKLQIYAASDAMNTCVTACSILSLTAYLLTVQKHVINVYWLLWLNIFPRGCLCVICQCVCLSVCHSRSYTITPVQCCLQLLIQCRCRIASSTLRLFWQISQTHWVHTAERLLAGVCMSFTCLTVALDTTSCSLHCSIQRRSSDLKIHTPDAQLS